MNFTKLAIALQTRMSTVAQASREQRGAAMAEYGLLLALVALAAIGILVFFGGEIVEVFTEAEDALNTRASVPPAD